MNKSLSLFLTAVLLASSAAQAQKLNPLEKRTLQLSPGVVLIVVTYTVTATLDLGKQEQSQFSHLEAGTGFLYRPDGYIITAGHVVSHANLKDPQAQEDLADNIRNSTLKPILSKLFPRFEQELKRPLTQDEQLQILRRIHITHTDPELRVYLANRKGFAADIKAYGGVLGQGKDVAIVKIDATNLPTVKLGNSDNVRLQEPLTVIGYPGVASPIFDLKELLSAESAFIPTVTNGRVSAVKSDVKGTPVIQTDAAVTHGNSGGPAFNDAGEAVGVADFVASNSVSGYNFFVTINTAWEYVRQAGSNPETSLFNQVWSEALDTYDAGKCSTAKEKFTDVLRILPGLPEAQRLSAAAEACAATQSPMSGLMEKANPVVYGVAGVILLLVLFLIFRKKPATAAAVAGAGPAVAGGPQPGVMPPPTVQMPPPSLPAAHFGSVQITAGALSGRRFPITKEGLLIGRDPAKCQVVLVEDTVSKEHAWIVPVDNGVVVIDRGSANGTYVNSTESPRISKVGLQNGDRVYIGKAGAAVLTYYTS